MYTDNLRVSTAEPGKVDSPNGHVAARSATAAPAHDPHIDTAAEARNWQTRMSSLAATANDPTVSAQARSIAARQLESMQKATPYQVASWRQIDEARKARGGR